VPSTSRLRAVWGTSANDVFVVGDSGTALRYDGVAWERFPAPTTRDLRTLWGRSPTEVYAAGDSGTVLRFTGAGWQTLTTPARGFIYAMFGIPGTAGLALVGEGARIVEGQP
jgi:photosystem II stability/assembly factor-like uncharacterized protein